MEENTKERICYLLAENHKLRNLNDELEKELALKDEIIRKQICMMSEGKNAVEHYGSQAGSGASGKGRRIRGISWSTVKSIG